MIIPAFLAPAPDYVQALYAARGFCGLLSICGVSAKHSHRSAPVGCKHSERGVCPVRLGAMPRPTRRSTAALWDIRVAAITRRLVLPRLGENDRRARPSPLRPGPAHDRAYPQRLRFALEAGAGALLPGAAVELAARSCRTEVRPTRRSARGRASHDISGSSITTRADGFPVSAYSSPGVCCESGLLRNGLCLTCRLQACTCR